MEVISRNETRAEAPIGKVEKTNKSQLNKLKGMIGTNLESSSEENLKYVAKRGLGTVKSLLQNDESTPASDKENLHPNEAASINSSKCLKKPFSSIYPIPSASKRSTSSRLKKGDVLVFHDANVSGDSTRCKENLNGSNKKRTTRSNTRGTKQKESLHLNKDIEVISIEASPSSTLKKTVKGKAAKSGVDTSVNAQFCSSSPEHLSSIIEHNNSSIGSLSRSIPLPSPADAQDNAECRQSYEKGSIENIKNKNRKSVLYIGRESIGSDCSESSLASDADTVVLHASDGSDAADLSPLSAPEPGTPGAKIISRASNTPVSSKKAMVGSITKSGTKIRLMCSPKNVQKMLPLPPELSPKASSSPHMVNSGHKTISNTKRSIKSLDSVKVGTPASKEKRKIMHEGAVIPQQVDEVCHDVAGNLDRNIENAGILPLEGEAMNVLSKTAESLIPRAFALFTETQESSRLDQSPAKGCLFIYGPGDFVIVAALSFLLALQELENPGADVHIEAEKLVALSPHLHYASVPAGVALSSVFQSAPAIMTGESNPGNCSRQKRNANGNAKLDPKGKKTVTFSQNDGSAVSPPNDRRPASWVNSYSIARRFHELVLAMNRITESISENNFKSVKEPLASSALFYACQYLRCDNEDQLESIDKSKQTLNSFFSDFLERNPDMMTDSVHLPRPFEAVKICGLLYEDLCLASTTPPSSNPASRPQLSTLRHRSSWMASSVMRFVIRWIFDDVPLNISTPSAAGPPIIPHCRSRMYQSLKLTSRENERLIAMCHGLNKLQQEYDHGQGESGHHTLPLPLIMEVDPAEMALSSLISCALRQLDKLHDILLSRFPGHVKSFQDGGTEALAEIASKLVADPLRKCSGHMTKEGSSSVRGKDDQVIADVLQASLAAEYGRMFLVNVVEMYERLMQSDNNPFNASLPYADSSLGSADVWSVLSTCSSMLRTAEGVDDRYLAVFMGGFSTFKERIRVPLLQEGGINECLDRLSSLLENRHETKRERVAARRNQLGLAQEVSNKPIYCWKLVHSGVIFDFPIVSVEKSGNTGEKKGLRIMYG